MTTSNTDPVVLAATSWIKQEVAIAKEPSPTDAAVMVYRMLAKFPMTAAQYWQTADESMPLMGSSSVDSWLSLQIWQCLSDWDGTGDGLHRLAAAANSFWAKSSAAVSSPAYMFRELRKRMSNAAPSVAWTSSAFKEWIANPENPLAQWTAQDVKALPTEMRADLLLAYLKRGGEQTYFELEAVRLLIDSRQWTAEQIQTSIVTYMSGRSGDTTSPQAMLIMDVWLDTWTWTPEEAEGNIRNMCLFLINANLHEWERFLPRIGEGLACMASNPGELYRIIDVTTSGSGVKVGPSKLLAMLIASVNAEMPEHFVVEAVRKGGMLSVLANKHYPIAQRLTWLKQYADYVLPEGDFARRRRKVGAPLRQALALWCFMAANKGDIPSPIWRAAGLVAEGVATKRFLETYAPSIVEHIDTVNALELSYADAVDMLIDTGDGKWGQPLLDLPDLADDPASSRP
jgi:hypothetical protein